MRHKSTILLLLAIGSVVSAQQPDSTLMQFSAEPSNSVPTTTIIPVAEPPIKIVDTTYIRTMQSDSVRQSKSRRVRKCDPQRRARGMSCD